MSTLNFMSPDSAKHKKFLDKASELSRLSADRRFKHGAIIVKNGKAIAVGINRSVNHPSICSNPKTEASVHAEVAALNACRKTDLSGAIIYVARTTAKRSLPAMSKPCENCQKALRERGIKKVYYTIDSTMDL